MTTEKQISAKQLAIQAIGTLPDDATLDEAIDCLKFVQDVQARLQDARKDDLIPHEQVKQHFAKWLR